MMYGRAFDWGYGMMGGGWLGAIVMLFFWSLVIAGAIALAVWVVRSTRLAHSGPPGSAANPPPAPSRDEAVAIARKRCANGEITTQEFEEIIRALGS